MKVAIMQPYFFPYIGYWQLINSVDTFVVYDNIQYTKKGWISRNRFLQNGKDCLFSISLKNDSNFLNVHDRIIADSFDRLKLLSQIKNAYQKAPYFREVFPVIEKIVLNNDNNLFDYIYYSIMGICDYLKIDTTIIVSSSVCIDNSLKAEKKVIAICKELNAESYVNAIGGQELYEKENFKNLGIDLNFLKTEEIRYEQFDNEFVPWLSIIDVIMFNSVKDIKRMLNDYELI